MHDDIRRPLPGRVTPNRLRTGLVTVVLSLTRHTRSIPVLRAYNITPLSWSHNGATAVLCDQSNYAVGDDARKSPIFSASAYPLRYMRSSPSKLLVRVDSPHRSSGARMSTRPSRS